MSEWIDIHINYPKLLFIIYMLDFISLLYLFEKNVQNRPIKLGQDQLNLTSLVIEKKGTVLGHRL